MGDAFISTVTERLVAVLEEQTRIEADLVRCVKDNKISKVGAELNRVRVMMEDTDKVKKVRGAEDKKINNLVAELNRVRDVLADANQKGSTEENIRNWLGRLDDACYELDEVLDEWNIALVKFQKEVQMEQSDPSNAPPKHKVRPFIPHSLRLCFKKSATSDLAMKIKTLKARLDEIFKEESRYNFLKKQRTDLSNGLERVSTSFADFHHIVGRNIDYENLVAKLLNMDSNEIGINLINSIVGTAGVGKTTLAQLVYNDSRVKSYFPLKFWICVSDPFDEVMIAKEIVGQVQESTPSTDQLERLVELVKDSISGKRFLLVLDDVWTGEETKWGPLKNSLKHGAAGSKVLVTTRNEMVARMMGTTEYNICHLEQLSDEECWSLLGNLAFSGKDEENLQGFRDIGRRIAMKCRGMPLPAKVLGSILRYKNTVEEWEDVLNNYQELWKHEYMKVDFFPHLHLSYNDLPLVLKPCFLYCGVFPKDYVINVDKLIKNWMALGYVRSSGNLESELELIGREYFDNLVMRSLFEDVEEDHFTGQVTKCIMSSMFHDLAIYLREGDSLKRTSCEVCDNPSSISRIKGPRSLFCDEKQPPLQICDCLRSLRVLSLDGCRLQSFPTELEKLTHLRELDLSENKLSEEDLKSICKIYNLQTLVLCYCQLQEIPTEIRDLIQLRHLDLRGNKLLKIPTEIRYLIELRHLDLSGNKLLKKLPESICDLRELRSLNVSHCSCLCELPQEIPNLVNLKDFYNEYTNCLHQYPQGLAELTGLEELNEYYGGRDRSKLGYLKTLNRLSRYLCLKIRLANLDDEVVEDAQEAQLEKKIDLKELGIDFVDDHADDQANEEEEPLCTDVLEALKPHENLQELWISNFKGSKLPSWIASPHYQLKEISIDLRYCLSLPPFGMLPCLEEITIKGLYSLEVLGREFLGITPSSETSSSTSMVLGFPKLRTLTLYICPKLREWEDITVEQQESDTASVMPCLTLLRVISCRRLTALPHRLLSKASSLKELVVTGSTYLRDGYEDKEGPLRKSISHIPNVTIF